MKSSFFCSPFWKKPSKKLISRKSYQLGRWHQVGKLSVLFCDCGQKQGKKEALYDLLPQEAIRQSDVFLLFVGDLNRAEKAVKLHEQDFHPEGVDNLLITSVDAALAAQNTLLAAESLGYGGVIIGMLRYCSEEVAELFRLPDYTYPVLGLLSEYPTSNMQ